MVKDVYKQTEVGVIPEDWEIATGAQVCELVVDCKNRTPPVVDSSEFAVVRTPNVRGGKFVREDLRFTDERSFGEWTARAVPRVGDILITREAPLGEVCLVPGDIKVCLGQRMMLYRPDREKTDSAFLLYALMSTAVQNNLQKKVGGSTVGHAKVDDIRGLQVPFPPTKAEQGAIADALSDADALIESLEQLIAKKRDLKQGAMQELLTGKKRLPGFSCDWAVKRLEELAQLYQPVTISADVFTAHGYPVYGANGVVGYYSDFNHDSWQITVTCRGSTCGTVNKTVDRCWITGNAMVVNCDANNQTDKTFLYYLLASQDLSVCITGTGQPQIVRTPLADFDLNIPNDIKEQGAIAAILTDVDAEIAALETKLAKTRSLKQGMMQELFTGRVRFV
jgi:type I restriction enzyme S subunit